MKWEYRGKDKGFFCPACGSGCLLNYESDFFPSDYCPHCGQKLEKPDEGWNPCSSSSEVPSSTPSESKVLPRPYSFGTGAWDFD